VLVSSTSRATAGYRTSFEGLDREKLIDGEDKVRSLCVPGGTDRPESTFVIAVAVTASDSSPSWVI